jgi:hypothetical protein
MTPTIIAAIITGAFELLRTHLNKPVGWKPTQQDIDDFLASVDLATPAHEKALARERLGLPPIPEM